MEGVLGQLGGFDPVTQGILSAAFKGLQMSGPSVGRPVGLGQIIGGAGEAGMGAYTQAQKTMMDEAYRRRLMEMEQVKTELAKQQLTQAQRKDQMLMGLLGGVPGASGGVPGASGGAPAVPGTPMAPAGGGAPVAAPSASGMPSFLTNPAQALAAQALGLPGSVDLYKHLSTPDKREGGSTYINRTTGEREFMPKLDVGMAPGPNGSIGVAPGAPQAIATLEGAKEGAKAAFDPYKVEPTTPGGTPVITNRAAVTAPSRAPASGGARPTPSTMSTTDSLSEALASIVQEYAQNPEGRAEAKKSYDKIVSELNRRGVKVNVPLPNVQAAPSQSVPGIPSGLSENQKATVKGSETAAGEFIKEMRDNYAKLRDVPVTLATLDKAASLVPSASGFMGPLGQQKLEVSKFLRSNVPGFENFKGESVASAEELRSAIFTQIMDNLKKMDSQPSQQQQQVMQDALGKLGTDPQALPRVLNVMRDVMKQKVEIHNSTVRDAESRGTQFPYGVTIDLNAGRTTELPKTPAAPSVGAVVNGWKFKGGDPGNRMNWTRP